MAWAKPEFDAVCGDHLEDRTSSDLLGRRVSQKGFQPAAGVHVGEAKIEPVVMSFATTPLLDCCHALAKGLFPFHQRFEHEHGGKQGIPLWQVHAKSHAARLLAADQHLSGQHFSCDVLEAHWQFKNLTSQIFCNKPHEVGAAHRFHHRPRKIFGTSQIIDQQWHQLLGAAEPSGFIHGGNAVTITIKNQSNGIATLLLWRLSPLQLVPRDGGPGVLAHIRQRVDHDWFGFL
jgi:hypothetical protein